VTEDKRNGRDQGRDSQFFALKNAGYYIYSVLLFSNGHYQHFNNHSLEYTPERSRDTTIIVEQVVETHIRYESESHVTRYASRDVTTDLNIQEKGRIET
jgi:hypothetical protein